MTVRPTSMAYRRLRAPREHGSALIDPPLVDVPALAASNATRRAAAAVTICGRPLADLAAQARLELIEAAYAYTSTYRDIAAPLSSERVFVAGHQPELFHPGVWFKNFVLDRIAREQGATAVNLLVDSDTIKHVSQRVPSGSLDAPVVESIPFDASSDEIPYEERDIEDKGLFTSFGARAAEVIRPIVPDPLIEKFWPLAVERSAATRNLGACLAQARHRLEGTWGLHTYEIPQSHVCGLPAFHLFAVHLLAELPRLRPVYNDAVDAYRRINHVRSANHPVPNLAVDGDWIEAPFWLWSTASPRRRRVFVRRTNNGLAVTDRRRNEFELPLGADGDPAPAVAVLSALPERGIKFRSRALVTTLFARMVLCDLFLHGIGGAKYDQLTDELMRQFFGLDPFGYLVLSATLHLSGAASATADGEARQLDSDMRDLEYHPEVYLRRLHGWSDAPVDVEHWIELKSHWLAVEQTRENARTRCHAIRAANEALQAWTEPHRRELVRKRQEAAQQARAAGVLTSREYAFCLYPEATLRKFLLDFHGTTL